MASTLAHALAPVAVNLEKQYYGGRYHEAHDQHLIDTYYEMLRRKMNAAFWADIHKPEFAYSRAKSWGVIAYMRNPTSPTGVLAGATAANLEDAAAMLDAKGKPFPLSPTEGLNKSGANATYETRY